VATFFISEGRRAALSSNAGIEKGVTNEMITTSPLWVLKHDYDNLTTEQKDLAFSLVPTVAIAHYADELSDEQMAWCKKAAYGQKPKIPYPVRNAKVKRYANAALVQKLHKEPQCETAKGLLNR